jgi:NADP-dependent 3-hydroxy acid dehydrogenase YdfG
VVLAGRAIASLAAVAADLPSDRTLVCKTDVSADRDDVDKLVKTTKASLDVLVSNAGVAAMGTVVGQARDWDRIMANVAVLYGARAAMPHLMDSRGCASSTSHRCRGWWRLGPGVLQRVQRARWST